jgi:aerobic carbon-monoxide dehydrogenase large subunit
MTNLAEFKNIGKPVRRKEDARLLTGKGRYTDDFKMPGQTYAAIVRSPYPHAKIVSIDREAARQMPGVVGVFTGEDCAADHLASIPHSPLPKTDNDLKLGAPDGGDVFIGPHVLLPTDTARHLGEAVAIVVAESYAQALDAAENVAVDYDVLPHNIDGLRAANGDEPVIWNEVPANVCIDTTFGDVAGTEQAFAAADHIVTTQFHIDRVTGVPMEPRSALGSYDRTTERYTIHAGSGGSVRQKRELAKVLGVEPNDVRVLSYDVGGNFGTRNRVYVEFGLVAWASKKLGRPVKYTSDRSEAFISDYQGRDLYTTVELALKSDGNFLGMRADNISNVGARAVSFSPLGKGSALISGSYRMPVACIRARAVFTNTIPTQAYRSSGRPEVIFAIERLVEMAADEIGMDVQELKNLNLLREDELPYANPIDLTYDSGDYHKSVQMAKALADWDGRDARRLEAKTRGKILGVGFANYVESSIGTPIEQAELHVQPEGRVDLVIGTQPSGQGHETSFAQVAADWLGLRVEEIQIVLGDTDIVKIGGGSHSGRSMRMAGTVIVMACDELIEKARSISSHFLEAAVADIEFAGGDFAVKGTDRKISLYDLAKEVETAELPKDLAGGLNVIRSNEMHTPVVPNGCHICEVELDPDTGALELVRYAAVDDVGRAINPMIVEGQTHGAIVQGLGQAMVEACVLDPENGQTLTGSLMDYGLPRAGDVPSFKVELNEVPSPTNPLGIKAGGEGGTTAAPAVYINAVVDALKVFCITDIKMPATPFAIWQAIQDSKKS